MTTPSLPAQQLTDEQKELVSWIEDEIAANRMSAPMVFTKMRALLAPQVQQKQQDGHASAGSVDTGSPDNSTPTKVDFESWASDAGYDTAHTYDPERSKWVFLNPMTADLWKAYCAALAQAPAATQPSDAGAAVGVPQWRCFHCDATFTDTDTAREHFGPSEHSAPGCQIDLAEYRRMQEAHRRQCEEDTDWHRAYYKLGGEHERAMRGHGDREYARGLHDGVNLPTDSPERISLAAAPALAPQQTDPVAMDDLPHQDKCRWWRHGDHCDCGAAPQQDAPATQAQAEQDAKDAAKGQQWIRWAGGPCPVAPEAVVFALHRNGSVNAFGLFARAIHWEPHDRWSAGHDVVAYYVVTENVGTLDAAPHVGSFPPPPRAALASATKGPKP